MTGHSDGNDEVDVDGLLRFVEEVQNIGPGVPSDIEMPEPEVPMGGGFIWQPTAYDYERLQAEVERLSAEVAELRDRLDTRPKP